MAFDSDGEVEGSISIFAAPKRKRAEGEIVASQPDQSVEKSIEDGESKQVRSFTDLGMDPWACKILSGLSITSPTAVQANCIPEILAGQEVVAAAKTGSGKTAAFALPILHMLSRDPHRFFALVLTPTRELALQIAEQFSIFGKPINATICVAVGGMDMTTQALELTRRPHIIVATPGRLADLLESGQIKFDHLRYLVFDEADRLLASDASFLQREIPLILERITSNKVAWQFFSATMSADVFEFQKLHRQSRPFSFDGNTEFGTVSHLDQRFILVPSQVRDANLVNLLRGKFAGMSIIIFTGKCKNCELLLQTLLQLKIQAVALHSKMPQRQRLASLNKFKSGSVRILISTDVGSRGLDIPIVDAVINFDLPADARDYVHRVGRAARAGKPGMALSFVQELDLDIWSSIEAKIDKKIPLYQFAPLESDVVAILNEVTAAKREAGMILHDRKFGAKAEHNKKKLES